MKNFLIVLSIAACLQACNDSPKPTTTATTAPTDAPTTAPTAAAASPTTAENDAKNVDFAKKTSAAIQGKWRSTIDPKSEIRIEGDEWTDVYSGKKLATGQLSYSADCKTTFCKGGEKDCFMVIMGSESYCYWIDGLTADVFNYTMIGAKMQMFKRIK
jgi:hypothetical protein